LGGGEDCGDGDCECGGVMSRDLYNGGTIWNKMYIYMYEYIVCGLYLDVPVLDVGYYLRRWKAYLIICI